MAVDLRGHGLTRTGDDADLSAETLSDDICRLAAKVAAGRSVMLVGHSMGGAIAVHAAGMERIDALVGLCVIDVVEGLCTVANERVEDHRDKFNQPSLISIYLGTAMDALSSMQSFLRGRPDRFRSLELAIEWSVRTGQVRNVESARVSMPGQLRSRITGECAVKDVDKKKGEESSSLRETLASTNSIKEEDEEGDEFTKPKSEENPASAPTAEGGYTWRVDLASSEAHWPGWFGGLSQRFLSAPASKLLLLAGVDRLDRDLTVGQMQGKFQMQVLPQAGHAVHEDLPDRVADVLATFLVRNRFAEPLDRFQRTFPAC